GGLFKAIKFVPARDLQASQELESLQRVKAIRHPFILSLERVEVVGDTLFVVMELADRSLGDMCAQCRTAGLPGIPRRELLGLLLEAAEALDWMGFAHNLQHLDIKPHNLFLVSNHLKVADFGLVHQMPGGNGHSRHRGGGTPLYAAPEILRGN